MVYFKIRRSIDILLSLLGLIILSPVFLVIILAIKFDSPGPVLFKQKRVAIHKRHFNILKFRTMRIDTPNDTPTHLLVNPDEWITKIGKFLRKTSLDELPQVWNIFIGQMSIIGPRPALWNQYDLIKERDKYKANDVPVGLTGWAQINGRDELEIDMKARLDGEYVERIGFFMDVRCFFGTVINVLRLMVLWKVELGLRLVNCHSHQMECTTIKKNQNLRQSDIAAYQIKAHLIEGTK